FRTDRLQRARHVARCFDVDSEIARPRVDIPIHPGVRPLDHEVDVQRQPRRAVQVGDHLWTEREVRDEVTVHHVDVDPVGTRPLQDFLRTQQDVLMLTASGSGGMEAAVANTLSSGEKVLVFSCGAFGERFAAICKAYGVDARRVDVPYGRAVEPDLVRDELAKEKGKDAAKAVLITHNETSTGVLNPMKDIAAVVRDSGKLFLVDSVSGAGCTELEIDE